MKRYLIPFLLVFAASAFGLTLQWTSNQASDNVTKYTVYDHVGAAYNVVATVTPAAGATQSWTIPTPVPSPGKIYAVSASNLVGESAKTEMLVAPPSAVTGLTLGP